jgi:hypothetical protein
VHALSLFSLVLLATSAWVPPSQAADNAYLAELQGRAKSLALHEDRYWRILLHVRPGIAGTRSLVDDPRFFLSPSGKTDPSAELAATLDGLFDTTSTPTPFCRFPARYAWLAGKLGIDPTRIPRPPACPEVDNILRTIDGQSAELVFASGYVNSPASMFGHTFLRIDSGGKSPLLSFAVNYAARTDPSDGGIAFTAKGMFGGYQGYYSVMPYYDKVREYSNIDQRDLWEYPLNLTPDEVRRLLLHLVEMKDIATDYFFFDENCSYELLFLVDAARPGARLTETMDRYWVIPMDTVRAVIGAGLVDNVVWRPSRALRIRHARSLLPEREAGLAVEIVDGAVPAGSVLSEPVPDAMKARTLELAALLAQYRIAKKGMEHKVFQERFHAILSARTRLGPVEEVATPLPVPDPPEDGHRSARARIGGGWRGREGFLEAGIRPAYHDYTDPPEGYTQGSLIEFLSGTVRWYPEGDRVRMSRLDLIRIESLDPFDPVFRKKSWKVRMGFETRDFTGEQDALVSFAGVGIGGALRLREGAVAYLLGEVEGSFSRRYHSAYRIGGGASAGITAEPIRGWLLRLEGRGIWGALGETREGPDLSASLRQGFRIGRDLSLTADLSRSVTHRVERTEGTLSLNRYF